MDLYLELRTEVSSLWVSCMYVVMLEVIAFHDTAKSFNDFPNIVSCKYDVCNTELASIFIYGDILKYLWWLNLQQIFEL